MQGDRESREAGILHGLVAANDNGGAQARVDAAVLTLARLIGRRIAREALDRPGAANDNAPARKAVKKQES